MKAKRETGTSFWEAGKKSGEKVMGKEKMNFRRMIVYLLGLAIMAAGSNLFLKADLGVAPSCTAALLLTRLFPATAGGYALFNFIVNFCFLCAEIAVEGKMEKRYPVQFLLIFSILCLFGGRHCFSRVLCRKGYLPELSFVWRRALFWEQEFLLPLIPVWLFFLSKDLF